MILRIAAQLADHTVERYLGPDTEEVRARVKLVQKVNEDLRQRENERGRLARMCREGGLRDGHHPLQYVDCG